MQSPALDERERGGQIREGYGRLQEPGTTPDVVLLLLRIWPTAAAGRPRGVSACGDSAAHSNA